VANYVRAASGRYDKVHVVMNGVNPVRFSPQRLAAREDERPFTIGFVGTMKPWHGLDTLVEAFQQVHETLPRSQLLLVGDGPFCQKLKSQLMTAAPSFRRAVRLVGAVPPADVPSWVSQFDVAVACPPLLDDYYFSPLKLFEYMAAGLPVVASRTGQISEILEHGLHGLLCTAGCIREVASALLTLAQSPAMRQSMGRANRARILERHTWSSVVDRIATIAVTSASPSAPQPVGAR
jgi:glycosyltransferase involved in cell wall biosynthesis